MAELIRHTEPEEIGVDEAGRGCLAGPVVAASFYMPSHFVPPQGLNDSKKMSAKARDYCYEYLMEHYGEMSCVAMISARQIDRDNILIATMIAMHEAVSGNPAYKNALDMNVSPMLLVDGNHFDVQAGALSQPRANIAGLRYKTVVKGDGIYYSIAAASVIAKVSRDRHMTELSKDPKYAVYGWDKNKSYCTPDHMKAIMQYGKSDMHRMTFKVPGYDK